MSIGSATYSLADVKALVAAGDYRITGTAFREAAALGFDESDILDCINKLSPQMCWKTMPSNKVPGLFQDVYRVPHLGLLLYVKVQIVSNNGNRQLAVIVQCKEK